MKIAPSARLTDEIPDRQRPADQLDVVERLIEDGRVCQAVDSPKSAPAWL